MAKRNGLDYFMLSTDLFTDDEKVFDLMEGAGWGTDGFAAVGRWLALLMKIYREGPALVVDQRMERKLARDLDMTRDELSTLIDSCAAAGLFDCAMWDESRVITSHGIQVRWCGAKRKKPLTDELPKELQQWSLLGNSEQVDDDPSDLSENSRETAAFSGNPRETAAFSGNPRETAAFSGNPRETAAFSGNPRLEDKKKKEEEIRKEEEDEEERESAQGSSSSSSAPPILSCMAATSTDETVFMDTQDCWHETPGEALQASYQSATGLQDFPDFVMRIGSRCPAGCRGDPERRRQCYQLVSRALAQFDPRRGSSPLPLALKIIDQDRGF